MIIQVPEHFSNNKDILKLEDFSILYYFNRNKSEKMHIQITQHMLLHVFNGSKIIYSEDQTYTVTDKQSVFISSGEYFMSEVLSLEKSHFDGVMVFFDDTFLISFFNKYQQFKEKETRDTENEAKLCIVEDSEALHETMRSAKVYLERKSDDPTLIHLKFEEIFLQLLQSEHAKMILNYFQHLYASSNYRFKQLFEHNTFQTVEEMMRASKLSEAQFRKIFKEIYNTTPKEWLLHKSLQKAKILLDEKNLNVTDVSYECGFNSISWFIKSFKKEFGITPKQYQQNC